MNCIPSEITIAHPIGAFRDILPLWAWNPADFQFNWSPSFPPDHPLKSYASISSDNWFIANRFLSSLRWDCSPDHQTAYIELAFAAWYSDVKFVGVDHSPREYAKVLRKTINQCSKLHHLGSIVPGPQKSGYKSRGRTTPAGYIQGGWPSIPPNTLKQLAICFFKGKSQHLSDWGDHF